MFGLPIPSDAFVEKVKQEFPGETVATYQASALAYIHARQLARALHECGGDLPCAREKLGEANPEPVIGFQGFANRMAKFD